jgi:catalase (peroxidase I)
MLIKSLTQRLPSLSANRGTVSMIRCMIQQQQQHNRRSYHSSSNNSRHSSTEFKFPNISSTLVTLTVASSAILYYTNNQSPVYADADHSTSNVDYNQIQQEIISILDNDEWDDGSLAPHILRLAWHSSGTYIASDNTGGSNGGCIRFKTQQNWGANAGIKYAVDFMEPIKKRHPEISYADLYTLAGVVALEEMGK